MATRSEPAILPTDLNDDTPYSRWVGDLEIRYLRGNRSLVDFLKANATPIEQWRSLYRPAEPKPKSRRRVARA